MQKILDYKQTIEETMATNYNIAKNIHSEEELKLSQIIQLRDMINSERSELMKQTTVSNLKTYNMFMNQISKKIHKQEEQVDKSLKNLNKSEDNLIIASKEKKVFEKLRERDIKEYRYLLNKEDEKIIDQIVSYNNSIR